MNHRTHSNQDHRIARTRRWLGAFLLAILVTTGARAEEPLSIIFASDPQLWWGISGATSDDGVSDEEIEIHNRKHTRAMEDLINGSRRPSIDYDGDGSQDAIFSRATALIANGDLTEYGRWSQWDAYEEMFRGIRIPIYPGLGNHDYGENLEGSCGALQEEYLPATQACVSNPATAWNYKHGEHACVVASHMLDEGQNWCIRDAMRRMKHWIASNSGRVVDSHDGSAAYSFDLNGIHFIQLHNYPSYEYSPGGVSKSLDWLRSDLAKAAAKGQWVVINMHDSGNFDRRATKQYLYGYEDIIVGVFMGHIHQKAGYFGTHVYVGDRAIPMFYSGAAESSAFSLAQFDSVGMTVQPISSKNGRADSFAEARTIEATAPGHITTQLGAPVTFPWPSDKVKVTWVGHDKYTYTHALGGTRGRFVTISLPKNEYLSLAEVQVLDADGNNLALDGQASQSSTYSSYDAHRAIDGNTDGVMSHQSATHTQKQRPWWRVDLGRKKDIAEIRIYNRTDCCTSRLNDAIVKISDTIISPVVGGTGGRDFFWDTHPSLDVFPATVKVRGGARVDAIQIINTDGSNSGRKGGGGGSERVLSGLDETEYIDFVRICKNSRTVNYLKLRTNFDRILVAGSQSSGNCRNVVDGQRVVGFWGSSGAELDSLGVIFENFTLTNWLDKDDETGSGDYEDIARHRAAGRIHCPQPFAIEARRKSDEADAVYVGGGDIAHYDTSYGFLCLNDSNSSSPSCDDYEVRYSCDIPTGWLDRDNGSGSGDYEQISQHYSAGNMSCTDPIGIEARRVSDHVDAHDVGPGQNIDRYDTSYGFKCVNRNGFDPCSDYEVRYWCD